MENLEPQEPMQQPEPSASPWSTALNYGVIGGISLAILSVIVFLLNLNSSLGWIETVASIGIFIAVIIIATKQHRDQKLNGFISFGKAFTVGFLTSLVMAVIGAVFNYVYIEFIDPSILKEAERTMREGMAESDMSREEMDQAMKFSKYFISAGFMTISGFIGNLVMGLIIALIGGAIYQRES